MPRGKGRRKSKVKYESESESDLSGEDSQSEQEPVIIEEEIDEDEIDEDNSVEDEIEEDEDEDSSGESNDNDNDDECVYSRPTHLNIIDRIKKIKEEEEEEEKNKSEFVPDDERMQQTRMTKYEWVRLISDRTAQISRGGSIMIKNAPGSVDISTLTPKQIAIIELESNRCPLYLIRHMTDGTKERWYPHEMKFDKRYIKDSDKE